MLNFINFHASWKYIRPHEEGARGQDLTRVGLAHHDCLYFCGLNYRSDQVRGTNWTDEILWWNRVCVVGERREYTALSLTRKGRGLYK